MEKSKKTEDKRKTNTSNYALSLWSVASTIMNGGELSPPGVLKNFKIEHATSTVKI